MKVVFDQYGKIYGTPETDDYWGQGDNLTTYLNVQFLDDSLNPIVLSASYTVEVVVERPDGQISPALLMSKVADDNSSMTIGRLTITNWITEVAGKLKFNVRLKETVGGVIQTKVTGICYRVVGEAIDPADQTITDVQYQALLDAISDPLLYYIDLVDTVFDNMSALETEFTKGTTGEFDHSGFYSVKVKSSDGSAKVDRVLVLAEVRSGDYGYRISVFNGSFIEMLTGTIIEGVGTLGIPATQKKYDLTKLGLANNGTLSGLQTTNKTTLVAAINEVLSLIPVVNNATLTLKAGSYVKTFTANQSTNETFEIKASDLGLEKAMSFIGTSSTAIADGDTTNPITISGDSVTAKSGDVVLYSGKEFIWNGSSWEELGDENVSITGDGALEGGGTIVTDRQITHKALNTSGAISTLGLYCVTVDKYGHITSAGLAKKADITALGIPALDSENDFTNSLNHFKNITVGLNSDISYEVRFYTSGSTQMKMYADTDGVFIQNSANNGEYIKLNVHGGTITYFNGSASKTYTLPSSTGTLALISDIPTKTSDLLNDSSFVDGSGLTADYIVLGNDAKSVKISNKTISDIVNIAEGKTASYVCSTQENQDLNSSNASITITTDLTSYNAINTNDIPLSSLHVGDIIYVVELDLPDRWVSSVTDNGNNSYTVVLQKMETTKVDLSGYQTKIDSSHKLDSDLVDDSGNQNNKFVTQDMYNYLDNLLYQAPEITLFSVSYNNGVTVPTTNEVGSTFSVDQITYTLTNLSNVSGNLTLTVGGTTQTITPSSSDVVNLTSAISVSSNTTFTLSGTDTKGNTFSKTYTMAFNTYTYTKATSSSTAPTSSLIKQTGSSYNIPYSAGDYIYFYSKSSGKTVQQNVLGTWTNLTTTSLGSVTITQSNGATGSYYAYRIGAFANGGTDTFRLN